MKKKFCLMLLALSLFSLVQAEEKTVDCGSSVKIEATAKTGYRFKEWSDGVKDNPRTFTSVKEAKTLTAYFEKMYSLTFDATDGGQVDKTSVTLAEGEQVVVTASVTDDCFEFDHWSDDVNNTNPVRTITANGSIPDGSKITAIFKLKTYKFTITPQSDEMGTISITKL